MLAAVKLAAGSYKYAPTNMTEILHALPLPIIPLSSPLEEEGVAAEDTERALIARSNQARVCAERAVLSEEQCSAIMLVCVQSLSYQQAAAELNIPLGTLMSRLSRGCMELAHA
jgi:DNA-directed RNA polymerase specialized sigma24 family protein